MFDPKQHAAEHGWIETILRYIPGFRGYLDAEDRRESDRLTRVHLVNRLGAIKQKLDAFQEQLVNAGNLDDLMQCERVVSAIMTLGNRMQGDVQGYSGFFDFVTVDNAKLDRIYEHDLSLVNDVELALKGAEQLASSTEPVAQLAAHLKSQIDALAQKFQERTNILQGLA